MTKEEEKKENAKLIADAMREALRTLASEKIDARHLIAVDAEKAAQVVVNKSIEDKDAGSLTNILYKQVSLILSVCGVVLAGFIFLTSPGTKNDTALQLQEQRIEAQDGTILALTKTQQNDTQEVKANIALMTTKIEEQSVEIAKLVTIINERIPAKK